MLKFGELVEGSAEHPVLTRWHAHAAKTKTTPTVEATRPRLQLGYGLAQLKFSLPGNGAPRSELVPWDAQLALETAELGWKGPKVGSETTRTALLLKYFLDPTVVRFGDGFFSSVLIETIKTSDASSDPEVAGLLRFISTNKAQKGAPLDRCREEVVAALARIAKLVKNNLKYKAADAEKIWLSSVVYYLDDRFSITDGRTLGLYREG